jgi:hypothetical protein
VPVEQTGGRHEANPVEGAVGAFHILTVVSAKLCDYWATSRVGNL